MFGYTWALPQVIKQAGMKYFMTTKIGWTQYNRLPYDTFLWQGIDGTRILTHFITVDSKPVRRPTTRRQRPESLGTWNNFQQKDIQSDLLLAFGYGDGGGGPTKRCSRQRGDGRLPGLPQVKPSSARDFFQTIATWPASAVPVWNGELYLEYHRGTYTTQARNKRANRKSEFLLTTPSSWQPSRRCHPATPTPPRRSARPGGWSA